MQQRTRNRVPGNGPRYRSLMYVHSNKSINGVWFPLGNMRCVYDYQSAQSVVFGENSLSKTWDDAVDRWLLEKVTRPRFTLIVVSFDGWNRS